MVFTASSALDVYRGEADLSRRVLSFELPGMSFREYLELIHHIKLPILSLEDILKRQSEISYALIEKLARPLPLFREYLKKGYLPFSALEIDENYLIKLHNVINATLTNDLAFIENYSATHVVKLKKLLAVLSESAPFEPNIAALARKLALGRDTVSMFIQHLNSARMINLLNKSSKGVAALQKPDKVYLENTNFSFALRPSPETGTLRETFLLNQLRNAGHTVHVAPKSDFQVNNEYNIEVGGKKKSSRQIKGLENAFVAADEITSGVGNTIPLWLFGFLY